MKSLPNLCPKQTIRTLSFVFLASLLNMTVHSQGAMPPQDYFRNIEIADSLSAQKNYKAATDYYSKAIKAFNGQAYPDDRYNAARAWAYAGHKDSAFALLEHLATKSRYWNYQRFLDDSAFKSFNHLYRYSEIEGWFEENKKKYCPQINIEFYNALDSIHIQDEQNRKRLVLAASNKENVLQLSEQIRKKDSLNLKRVTALLDKYGWPDSAAVDFYGNYTLLSMIKQSPRAGYEKYHKMMEQASLKATPTLNLPLVAKLDSILINDQQDRVKVNQVEQTYGTRSKQWDSLWKKINYQDSINQIAVTKIIDTYGWPGPDIVGYEGCQTVFLVVQHAPLAMQEKYLPVMREAVKNGKAKAFDLAMLEDRVRMGNDKPQIYGSQLHMNQTTGKYEFWPIEDEANVNKRRAAVGLPPLEEYAKIMRISYKAKE